MSGRANGKGKGPEGRWREQEWKDPVWPGSGNRAGGDAEEMSLVIWTEGGCRSFSHKLNDPSPASDVAMCIGQS